MKIGLFTDTFYPEINGVATSCLNLQRELTRRGHEVHVYAPKCKGWEENQRENVHYLASAPLLVLKDRNFAFPTPLTSWEAEKIDFDVVHTNSEFVMGMFGHHVAGSLGCAQVHTYHTVWEDYTYYITHGVADEAARRIARKYSQWWCNRFDRVITPTGKTLDLLRKYGVAAPIDIIPSEENQRENVHYLASAPLLVLKDRNFAFPTPLTSWEAEKIDFDVVHTNSEFVMGMFGHHVAGSLGCAQVHTYHTVWEDYTYYITHGVADEAARRIARKYSQWWCNRFDRVITPTGKTLDLLRKYGVAAPIDIIPSGMDIARFDPARHGEQERLETRRECGLPEHAPLLLNIGRIAKEKNLEQVMRVFPRLLNACPDVHFAVVGEGPMREELGRMAEELGVSRAVTLTGPKPWEKIDRYYAMGDVFCSASHSETQGLTYVEAMASGLCVCAVNDPCLDGVIEDGVSGILSGDSDDELLAALIRAFGEEGRRIAKTAAQYAAPFSTQGFAEKVEACYMKAIEAHKRG